MTLVAQARVSLEGKDSMYRNLRRAHSGRHASFLAKQSMRGHFSHKLPYGKPHYASLSSWCADMNVQERAHPICRLREVVGLRSGCAYARARAYRSSAV